jgi:diacylglycerol kinase (ATP)
MKYAVRGIGIMVRSQHNAWIHALATVAVVVLGLAARLSTAEWCWIVLAIVAVWTAEALNTAFEFLTDVASPSFHPVAGKAKDVAAGAVLIAAAGSGLIGALVLGPHLARWLFSSVL